MMVSCSYKGDFLTVVLEEGYGVIVITIYIFIKITVTGIMAEPEILVTCDGPLQIIKFNNPARKNAITIKVFDFFFFVDLIFVLDVNITILFYFVQSLGICHFENCFRKCIT